MGEDGEAGEILVAPADGSAPPRAVVSGVQHFWTEPWALSGLPGTPATEVRQDAADRAAGKTPGA